MIRASATQRQRLLFLLFFTFYAACVSSSSPRSADPEPFFHVVSLFPKVFVLCVGNRCDRHRSPSPFWPPHLQSRVVIFDGDELHAKFAALDVLGMTREKCRRPYHKLITCLFFSYMVGVAQSQHLERVLYLEDDVHIVDPPRFDFQSLKLSLDTYPWHILRLGSTFHFAVAVESEGGASPAAESSPSPDHRKKQCTKNCACRQWGTPGLKAANESMPSVFCETEWAPLNYTQAHVGGKYGRFINEPGEVGCDLRSAIALGVHRSAYADVVAMRNEILNLMDARVAFYCGGGGDRRGGDAEYHSNQYHRDRNVSSTYNLTACASASRSDWQAFYGTFPWIDVWITQAFRNVVVAPALVNQKNDRDVGVDFRDFCSFAG